MPTHSHTSLELFERCALAYRMRYVDRLADRLGDTVEQHAGKSVHATLEWLHRRVDQGMLPLWEEILADFHRRFDGGWSDDIRMVRPDRTRDGYRAVGERCLRNYFENNTPFEGGSLVGTEWDFRFPISSGGPFVTGRIDRLTRIAAGHLEVHDYKTGSFVPPREQVERSRQAGLYALAVKSALPEVAAGRLDLVWHFLSSGIVMRFDMRPALLERIRRDTALLISRVEAASRFEPRPSKLCDWCEYGHVCPEFGYREKVRACVDSGSAPEPGVALVDRLDRLVALHREIERAYRSERERIEIAIAGHAAEHGVTTVPGTRMEAAISDGEKVRLRRRR
jgi:putative RecB family exonuclease